MSRGPGALQRALWETIWRHGKPMTFDDIRAAASDDGGYRLCVAFERSMRRALYRMVGVGALISIGGGGRADPFRYFLHPMTIAMMPEQTDALMDALAADPGANDALNKCLAMDRARNG